MFGHEMLSRILFDGCLVGLVGLVPGGSGELVKVFAKVLLQYFLNVCDLGGAVAHQSIMKRIYPLVHTKPYNRAFGAITLEMVFDSREPEPFECKSERYFFIIRVSKKCFLETA